MQNNYYIHYYFAGSISVYKKYLLCTVATSRVSIEVDKRVKTKTMLFKHARQMIASKIITWNSNKSIKLHVFRFCIPDIDGAIIIN